MSRQIYRQIGLIVALVVASVSLPVGIIGLTREPIIVNYYYNTYNNQTYYGGNETSTEPEPYYPPETGSYYNLTGNPEWFHYRVYNLTGDHFINWYINKSRVFSLAIYIIQDYMFNIWDEGRDDGYSYEIRGVGSAIIISEDWVVPFSDTWHFFWRYNHDAGIDVNITIRAIINKV